MKATSEGGLLNVIQKCSIKIGQYIIESRILPDISDQKSATYSEETGMGRAMPFKSYQHSDNRSIGWTAHYVVTQKSDIEKFLQDIRNIQSAVYPRKSTSGDALSPPYYPPVICQLSCGYLLSNGLGDINSETKSKLVYAIMKSYNIKYDTSVPWDEETMLPYKFDIDMQFEVIYDQSNLPYSDKIITF